MPAVTARPLLLPAVWAVAALLLSGCAAEGPGPDPSATPSATVSASPTPTPTIAPEFVPEGTAEENLPIFRAVVKDVWGTDQRGLGRSYVDALVAVGFDKGAMQVTQDLSTVGNPAESLEFSVRLGSQCLVGQVGTAIPKPVTAVMPALPGDLCLIGDTRAIDW